MSKSTIITRIAPNGTEIRALIHKTDKKRQPWLLEIDRGGEYTRTFHSLKRDAKAHADDCLVGYATPIKVKRTPEPATVAPVAPPAAQLQPADYASAMLASVKQPAQRITPIEVIAAAILFLMLVIGSAVVAPLVTAAIIGSVAVIKFVVISVATAMIVGALCV